MKKTILVLAILTVMSPFTFKAEAATLQEQLFQAIGNNSNAAVITDIVKAREQLTRGDKELALQTIATAAINASGKNEVNAVAGIFSGNDANQVIKDAIKQSVESTLSEKFGQYTDTLNALASLLNPNSQLTPQAIQDSNSITIAPANYKRVLQMKATAYSPGTLENGKWNNLTYMGGIVRKGVIAVDPSIIPMGSKVWVEGYGTAIAEDQGSAIKGNRIDLAFDSRKEALDYGIKNVKLYILE